MASGLTPTTGDAFLKTFYSPNVVVNTIARHSSRALNLIKHFEGGSGRTYNFMAMIDEFPSGSQDFDEAFDSGKNNGVTLGGQFSVPWYEDHGVARVSSKFINETRNDSGAWMKGLRWVMDSEMRYLAHRDSVALYTTGFGELAKITYTASNTYFTCQTASHIHRFIRGQKLVFSLSLSSNVLKAGTAYVQAVDRKNARVYVSATSGGAAAALDGIITSPATGDWVFNKGDRQNSATPTRVRPIGFPGWFPTTVPTSDDLGYGVNRGLDSRYAGSIIDSGATIVDRLMIGAQTCSSYGNAEKMVALVSPSKFTEVSQLLQGQKHGDTTLQARGGIGYKTLVAYADGIELPVISDKYCDDANSYIIEPTTFEKASMGAAPRVDDEDGMKMMRASDSSGLEARFIGFSNFVAKNPAACAVIVNPT